MSFLSDVGRRIKTQRLIMGMTQAELAAAVSAKRKITDKQLSRLETGTSGTGLETFAALSAALGKTPDYFLLGIDKADLGIRQDVINEIVENLHLCSFENLKNILAVAKAFSNNNSQ